MFHKHNRFPDVKTRSGTLSPVEASDHGGLTSTGEPITSAWADFLRGAPRLRNVLSPRPGGQGRKLWLNILTGTTGELVTTCKDSRSTVVSPGMFIIRLSSWPAAPVILAYSALFSGRQLPRHHLRYFFHQVLIPATYFLMYTRSV